MQCPPCYQINWRAGKAFQKEMTKAKRGTYRGGLIDDSAVTSIKFNY